MKRPITTVDDLRQHRNAIYRFVRTKGGRDVRVLVTEEGDLDIIEGDIRLLISFPSGIPSGPHLRLEVRLSRLLGRHIKILYWEEVRDELQKEELKKMKERAVSL